MNWGEGSTVQVYSHALGEVPPTQTGDGSTQAESIVGDTYLVHPHSRPLRLAVAHQPYTSLRTPSKSTTSMGMLTIAYHPESQVYYPVSPNASLSPGLYAYSHSDSEQLRELRLERHVVEGQGEECEVDDERVQMCRVCCPTSLNSRLQFPAPRCTLSCVYESPIITERHLHHLVWSWHQIKLCSAAPLYLVWTPILITSILRCLLIGTVIPLWSLPSRPQSTLQCSLHATSSSRAHCVPCLTVNQDHPCLLSHCLQPNFQ